MDDAKDKLVTAAIYKNDIAANIALGMLRANGIPCVLNGEIANNVLGIQLAPYDGIRLMVRAADLPEALTLLKDGELPAPTI